MLMKEHHGETWERSLERVMGHDVRLRITWNCLWWRVRRGQGEGVKEGHEEWEGTWERKRKVEDERVTI
jgi:hypothetical protein